ncbi:MAG: TetR/AcrR family transcriptional regulator [Sedimenticolaceae bacterium]
MQFTGWKVMARPVTFDRDEVLGRATEVFWEHGYCDTSVSQLVEATRLKPGSLYAAFESKEGLFLAALDQYAQRSRQRLLAVLAEAPDPLQGVERVFEQLAESSRREAQRGCLLVNSVLEVGRLNPTVQARARAHLADIEALLREALEQARANGQLAIGKSPESLAKFLMTTIWGLRVLGGTGADRESAQLVIAEALSLLRD